MAAGWLRHMAGNEVNVFTGGSEPGAELNPVVIDVMAEAGINIQEEFPKPWTDEIVRAVDLVIAMGCGDVCPIYPGKRYLDWELTDPAGKPIEEVRLIRDDIEQRVRDLLNELRRSNS
jgi:protein-tyrosine-phosphatase